MKLLNSFFTLHHCQEDVPGVLVCHISLNPDHEIFKAHFPGSPIVPGVCQIQIALELLSQELAAPLYLREVKNIKYLSVMIPTEKREYDVTFKKTEITEEKIKTLVLFDGDDKTYTKMSLSLERGILNKKQ